MTKYYYFIFINVKLNFKLLCIYINKLFFFNIDAKNGVYSNNIGRN